MTVKKTTTKKTTKKEEQTVKFNRNVKAGQVRYKAGDSLEVSQEEYEALASAGVIDVKDD